MHPDPVASEYARLAETYEARWKSYLQESVAKTLARLPSPLSGRVLDVGCGTGLLLQAIARREPALHPVGLDLSGEMLAQARRRLARPVTLVQGRAERLPFSAHTFDAAVSSSALHYIPDVTAALRELARLLRRGSPIVITAWCGDHLPTRLRATWLKWSGRPMERLLRRNELRDLLQVAGFQDVGVESYAISPWWGLMTASARA